MKKLAFVLLLTLFVSVVPRAQTAPVYRFGKVSEEELRMEVYEQDPEANAVILYKEVSLYYHLNTSRIDRITDYFVRVKILKPDGTKSADVSIPYGNSNTLREVISNIDAAAYNLEQGKIVVSPLKKQYVFREQISEHTTQLKFSVPEVKAGTVVEYRYRYTSPVITYIPSFEFQEEIPIAACNMLASIPEFFRFNLNSRGYVHMAIEETATNEVNYQVRNIRAKGEHIPALREEPYVWCLDDFRSALDFELSQIVIPGQIPQAYTTSWKDVDEALSKSTFNDALRIGNPFKDEVAAIKAKKLTPEQTLRDILLLVRGKIAWNKEYRLFSKNPRAAASKGSGSSADINFVLHAAVKDAGFKVVPVLLSPRHMGRLPYAHATIDGINAFILRVTLDDDNFVYLDGTDPNADVNLLPAELLVDRARIYGGGGEASEWCDLTSLTKGLVSIILRLELDLNNTLTGDITENYTDQAALKISTRYTDAKSEKEFIEGIEKEQGIQIENFKIDGVGTPRVAVNYSITSPTNSSEEFVYLNSTIIPFMSKNSFNTQSRLFPVEFPSVTTYNIRGSVGLPEGYTVEESPKSINMSACNDGLRCRYVSQLSGKFVQFNLVQSNNKLIFPAQEFEDLNTIYGLITDLSNSQLVIRKNAKQ